MIGRSHITIRTYVQLLVMNAISIHLHLSVLLLMLAICILAQQLAHPNYFVLGTLMVIASMQIRCVSIWMLITYPLIANIEINMLVILSQVIAIGILQVISVLRHQPHVHRHLENNINILPAEYPNTPIVYQPREAAHRDIIVLFHVGYPSVNFNVLIFNVNGLIQNARILFLYARMPRIWKNASLFMISLAYFIILSVLKVRSHLDFSVISLTNHPTNFVNNTQIAYTQQIIKIVFNTTYLPIWKPIKLHHLMFINLNVIRSILSNAYSKKQNLVLNIGTI